MSNKIPGGGSLIVREEPDGSKIITASIAGELFKEKDKWISYCPALDLSTCGKSKKEAIKNTEEAVSLFFESCIKHNTLEKALKELKWELVYKIGLDSLEEPRRPLQLPRLSPDTLPAFMIESVKKNHWTGTVEL